MHFVNFRLKPILESREKTDKIDAKKLSKSREISYRDRLQFFTHGIKAKILLLGKKYKEEIDPLVSK